MTFLPPVRPRATREEGLDAFRALGALGVIQLHFGPFRGAAWEGTELGILSLVASFLARLAVPFFFITSGYLLARRGAPGTLGRATLVQCRRILFLFVAWSLIALAFRGALRAIHHRSIAAFLEPSLRFLAQLTSRPLDTLLRGSEEHLWFLPALATGLALYTAFDALAWSRRLRPTAAAAVLAVGLLGGSYGVLDFSATLNPRSGPLLAFPLVTLGAWMAGTAGLGLRAALVGVLAGLAVMGFETFQFYLQTGASPVSHDALLGFFVAGPALLSLARLWTGRSTTLLAKAGRVTLGVYASHTLVAAVLLEGVRRVGPLAHYPILQEGGAFLLITVASFALAWFLSLIPITRRLVQ